MYTVLVQICYAAAISEDTPVTIPLGLNCTYSVIVKPQSQLNILYLGYVASGQTLERVVISPVPFTFPLFPERMLVPPSLLDSCVTLLRREWMSQSKYSLTVDSSHCRT